MGDLTVLSSWAEALAEAGSADEVDAVLADAAAGATWRAPFGLERPSDALGSALEALARLTAIRRRTQRRPTTRSGGWSAAVMRSASEARDRGAGTSRR